MVPTKAEQLGKFIRKQREARKLSMNALASLAKIEPSTIMRLERGEFEQPQPATLTQLARALGVEFEELFRRAPGYLIPKVPEFAPYLRSKLPHLPADRREEVEAYFRELETRYGRKGGGRGKRSR